MNTKNIGFKRNIIYAFSAQSISLLLSLTMALVIPKIIGVEQYGYWQLFLFYVGYVGYALLGVNDGIYLRIGGQDYKNLNFKKLGANYWISMFEQLVFATIAAIVFFGYADNYERKYVLIAVCIFWIINNATGFLSSVLQAVNRTYQFSTSVMIEKSVFLIFLVIVFLFGNIDFKNIIMGYIVSRITAMLYSVYCCRDLVFGGVHYDKEIFRDRAENIKVGAVLLISGVVSVLILGVGRQIIDWHWGVETFAIVSFSLSMTNFFLQFINQIGMVMFPMLRIITDSKKLEVYQIARVILSHLLTGILILYIPLVSILEIWLPEYQTSFRYLIFTLIICIFDGKMQMLFSTYMKVLRKERALLIINIASLAVSIALCFISAYVFNNFSMVVLCMALAIVIRSVISEIYIGSILNRKFYKLLIMEIALAAIFIAITWLHAGIKSFIIYFVIYSISLYIDKNKLKEAVKYIVGRR
ncbi:lipopolysaccharide biosynthesis protein [Konateibacter massiliensis]|uniref:lipopolysaccharide biosynthesis protein n=1 Tax=Konateibacter massiliensis TaxID=2002841 RepID=UPI00117AF25D|nr:hypothetical protein [Konateibacter massiliensis]